MNIRKSNHLNASNSDNIIGNSNLPSINVQIESLFNTLISLQIEIDTKSSIIINNETIYGKI